MSVNDVPVIGGVTDGAEWLWGQLSGPPGDPGRLRQIASEVDSINAEYHGRVCTINGAVDALTASWSGDTAESFRSAWHGAAAPGHRGTSAPALVFSAISAGMTQFANQLRDYADKLEHAQHEHWIELGVLALMTVVNAAQLGADGVTDAAELGAAAAFDVGSSFSLGSIASVAFEGAITNFQADLIGQFGADLWDRTDAVGLPRFYRGGRWRRAALRHR
jgi:uncharacterized protein YukE